MRPILLVGIIVFSVSSLAQQAPTFTVEAESAFVWGQDSPNGAFSSAIQDPLTGSPMHKLTYHGVEVGSRLGYEAQWVQDSKHLRHPYEVIISATTVVNNTDYPVPVEYGGASTDGRVIALIGDKTSKAIPRLDNRKFSQLPCFSSGSFPSEIMFNHSSENNSTNSSSAANPLIVQPKASVTVSAVIAVPSWHLPSEYRYYVRVSHKDYVFSWAMSEILLCGKPRVTF